MDSQVVIQRLNEVNERQRRTIDSLLNLIDKQNDMIKQQQEIIKDRSTNDSDIPDLIPRTTLSEAYKHVRLDESPENKIDLPSDKNNQPVDKQPDQVVDKQSIDEVYAKNIKSIEVFYDKTHAKLFYLLQTYSYKQTEDIADRYSLTENCAEDEGNWSYNDINTYLECSFAVSYDWIIKNMPTILDNIINTYECIANIAKYIRAKCTNCIIDNTGKYVYIKFSDVEFPENIIEEYKYMAERFIKYYLISDSTYENIKLSVSAYVEIYNN